MALSPAHERALNKKRSLLVRHLLLSETLYSELRSEYVLTEDYEEQIRAGGTRQRQVGLLLDTISHRTEKHFRSFIGALVHSGQEHLAEELDKNMAGEFIRQLKASRENGQGDGDGTPVTVTATHPMEHGHGTTVCANPLTQVSDGSRSSATGLAMVHSPPSSASHPVPLPKSEEDQIKHYISVVEHSQGEIQVCLPTMTLETCQKFQQEAYKMDSNPRGLAVIINNKIFVNMDDRSGTHCDLRMLKNLFTQLKFTVEEHNNRSADEIRKILAEVSSRDHSAYDAFVLVILSHGNTDGVYGTDADPSKKSGFILLDDIRSCFYVSNCRSLSGKPKMFFIQACQGHKECTPMYQSDSGEADNIDSRIAEVEYHTIPHDKADVVTALAAVTGDKAFRHKENGSCFIRTIVYVFNHYSHQLHLIDMLTKVRYFIGCLKISAANEKTVIQCTQSVLTLTKPVCFYPGT